MALSNLPGPFAKIDELVELGDHPRARSSLESIPRVPEHLPFFELFEVKLGLREGSIKPQMAMNRMLALMRADSKLAAANELYKEASELSYSEHESSMAHSHPPPPMKQK